MNKAKTQKGFIAIVAIGMFAVLAIFGVLVQIAVINSHRSIKNADNFYVANDIADSIIEHVRLQLNEHGAGYTQASACIYGEFGYAMPMNFRDIARSGSTQANEQTQATDIGATDLSDNSGTSIFSELAQLPQVGTELCPPKLANKDVKVVVYVKGRSSEQQALKTDCPGEISDDKCYIVPSPGTGTAGKRCNQYQPDYIRSLGANNFVKQSIIGGSDINSNLQQVDYSCNWNKLTFGSSATDRVAIPLYYEDPNGTGMISPYNVNEGLAEDFLLRVRTPCLPCAAKSPNGTETAIPGVTRNCDEGKDPTVCSAEERYELNTANGDDVVLQWKIQGKCLGQGLSGADDLADCSVIPVVEGEESVISAIYESIMTVAADRIQDKYRVLNNDSVPLNTATYVTDDEYTLTSVLQNYESPLLTLLLSNELISDEGKNIPYLEYQLVSDFPVASPARDVTVIINVDGNIVKKNIEIREDTELIDFAIQSN